MPAATVWGSVLLNKASSALLDGSKLLVGGAPGMGGRKLKSGGITSGALVVTANSSGDFLLSPAARRSESQPESAEAARPSASSVGRNFISNLMALGPVGPALPGPDLPETALAHHTVWLSRPG